MNPAQLNPETPIEIYDGIFVKREDLAWSIPPLSKARGVFAAIEKRSPSTILAVVDTGRSVNGWLVSTVGSSLGRKVIVGYPRYKGDNESILNTASAQGSISVGSELIPIRANRQFMMRYDLEQILLRRFGKSGWFLFPTGLRLKETAEAAGLQLQLSHKGFFPKTVVVPCGTGTHLAGLMNWATVVRPDLQFVAVQGYSRPEKRFRKDLETLVEFPLLQHQLRVVDPGYDYFEVRSDRLPPFPAHVYYEVKAWKWTLANRKDLAEPILFYNIGS